MGIKFSSRAFLHGVLLVLLMLSKGNCSRHKNVLQKLPVDASQSIHEGLRAGNSHEEVQPLVDAMDPSSRIFFTYSDLKVLKRIPIYLSGQNHSSYDSPHLLSRNEADSIPFSLSQLPYLLKFFGFSKNSPQAQAMEYTLTQCEIEPMKGETKLCATSLESMLDFARTTFGWHTNFKAVTTNTPFANPISPLQNYTILEEPQEILAQKLIGCHTMPYPYVVYYCHGQDGGTKLFQITLGSDGGERIEVVAVCHMDTSQWEPDHVSFRMLGIKPGTSPVCHVMPLDNIVWVPTSLA